MVTKLLTVMGWNIENFGKSKYTSHGAELIAFIAEVINKNDIDVAAFSEMRSNLGTKIGQGLATKLDTRQGLAAGTWKSQASVRMVPGRLEQYLFVWKGNKVRTYNGAPGPSAFQYLYDDPGNPGKKIGFPRQIKKDRSPFLGYFEVDDSANNTRKVLIAVMHSPGPSFWKNPRDAAVNMAKVAEFKNKGDTCVIVGDFNVKYQSAASVVNSNGEAAFGDLTANFAQAINPVDDATSLADAAYWTPPMVAGDYQNEPYDQIFFRRTAAGGGGATSLSYQTQNSRVDDVIQDCVSTKYLEASLGAIVDKYKTLAANTTKYANINDAFVDYRLYVSDHLPVFIQVDE